MSYPKVSILMSVYNGERYLREAVDSMLGQTFGDFEFLIVDDGSRDGSADIIRSYSDKRIRFMENSANAGLAASLNIGIDSAQGDYIARMDCDDISLPHRLEKQVAFLDSHPDVGICGGWISIDDSGKGRVSRLPADDATIRSSLVFDSTLAHPSVMMSRTVLDKFNLRYDATFTHAQDFDLWARSADHTRFANLQDVLLRYRVHGASAVATGTGTQRKLADRVRLRQLQRLGLDPGDEELALHHALSTWQFRPESHSLDTTEQWLEGLIRANDDRRVFPLEAFRRVVVEKWFYACNVAASTGLGPWLRFRRSHMYRQGPAYRLREAKLLAKCLLRRQAS